MTDLPRSPPMQKPKSLLEAHQDEYALIQALNEYAASQQKQSTTSDVPESFSQDQSQANAPLAESSTDSYLRPKSKGSHLPASFPRRRMVVSIQPSVSKLLELGVKVRDFAYESTLPPVPTVYLQPRQIQRSVPKDVNDPNDPHYVLEEERKKKVYTFESTRKIERTPTEPLLDNDVLPPPRRTFPGIKRNGAHFDLGSQFDSQPESQPPPSHQTLPYDITNTPLAVSQPVLSLRTNAQQTEPWVETPIVTPNSSLQWPAKAVTTTPAEPPSTTAKRLKGATSCSTIPVVTSEANPITTSDSQALSASEARPYSQLGSAHPEAQVPGIESGTRKSSVAQLRSHKYNSQPSSSLAHMPSLPTRRLTPKRAESPETEADYMPLVPTSPIEPSPTRDRASDLSSPARPRGDSPSPSIPGPSKLSPSSQLSSPSPSVPPSPRYNLRNRKKRRTGSPPTSFPVRSSSRPRLMRTRASPSPSINPSTETVFVKSMHLQDKALPGVVSTGRTMKRQRDNATGVDDAESISTTMEETRRSKRRNKAS